MTDIVERLRGKADWQAREGKSLRLRCSHNPSMPELAEMHEESADAMRSAADEIERLRAERDEAQAEANAGRQAEHDADQERDAARAEVARLRAAVAAARREGIKAAARHLEGWPVEDERMVADECAAAILAMLKEGEG